MKAFRLSLLLAACLVLVVILSPIFSAPLDENGRPVLFDDEDEFCAVPENESELDSEICSISPGLT